VNCRLVRDDLKKNKAEEQRPSCWTDSITDEWLRGGGTLTNKFGVFYSYVWHLPCS